MGSTCSLDGETNSYKIFGLKVSWKVATCMTEKGVEGDLKYIFKVGFVGMNWMELV
jgi:hypothetical protein